MDAKGTAAALECDSVVPVLEAVSATFWVWGLGARAKSSDLSGEREPAYGFGVWGVQGSACITAAPGTLVCA